MVGTSLRLFPAVHTYSVSVSYTWWFVFILSSAAARGGAISANSQRWVLHQPRTCYSFSPSYLFPSMPARCVGMSLCVMFLPCMCGDLLSSYFCTVSRILRRGLISLLDSVAGLERETDILSVISSQPSVQLVWALGALFFSRTLCFCFGCDHPEVL